MPRGPRLDEPLAVHHVWNRGIERCDIFRDDVDRLDFLGRIAAFVQACHFTVYAWALMSNHFHLLMRTGNLGLSTSMRILQGDYATWFNKRHGRCGHLFQNRFGSSLVGEDTYFLTLVSYIHLNPVRAGIVVGVEALDDYPWTGHAALLGHRNVPWQDTDFVLRQLGPGAVQAHAAYRSLIADTLKTSQPMAHSRGLRHTRGLWEDLNPLRRGREAWSFDERTYGSTQLAASLLAELNGAATFARGRIDAAVFMEQVAAQLAHRSGVQMAELRSNSKRPRVVQARRALCYLAVCHAALPARQVALQLGVQPYTVLRSAAGGEDALARLGCTPGDFLGGIV